MCACCGLSFSQASVHGHTIDAATKQPVGDVFIYFPELHLGQTSTPSGEFTISLEKEGRFLMQISHVGYENHFMTINLSSDTSLSILLKPALIPIKEVVVTGNQILAPEQTSLNVSQVSIAEMQSRGNLNLSDAISRLPGVSQLTTGAGISKPVIRGLYGNRIQVNVNGMRFDNQQWQDEHGLGLSDMGVDRVEIIKGPASVLYGSDAMGGVVNVIEEKPATKNTTVSDGNVRLYSNTYGVSAQYGVKKTTNKLWWKLRAGLDSHGDYSDGENHRILNSRFASYNAKASIGFNKRNWTSANNLFVSYSKFGFVFDSLSRKEEDARLSRSFDGPHHEVFFVQGTSENTVFRPRKKIKINGGIISNLRQEDEGGGGISLSMLLNSVNVTTQVNHAINDRSELIYGGGIFLQTNTNYGGRIIIPNAVTGEASVFSLYRYLSKKILFEGGLRYDYRFIGTYATGNLNVLSDDSPTQEIFPFNRFYNAFNASVGSTIYLLPQLNFKINTSSGYRPGNLAELSSNGLHEGTLRWEIGKPDARIEQNVNVEGTVNYEGPRLRASLSMYQNHFWNYIYLAPTGTEYFGFQIYRFEQSDATLKGGECTVNWSLFHSRITLTSAYSFISARKDDRTYLPFTPANKINAELLYKTSKDHSNSFVRLGSNYFFEQNHVSEFETPTNDYTLLYAGVSLLTNKLRWSLTCNNLLNTNYYDHLSRFKYYGIHNMGRNVVLSINFSL